MLARSLYPHAIIRGSSSAKPKINAISSEFPNAAHAQDDEPRPHSHKDMLAFVLANRSSGGAHQVLGKVLFSMIIKGLAP